MRSSGTSDTPAPEQAAALRSLFAGPRGRLLAALLFSEFGAAVQSIAYSSVLPVAVNQLHGADLYGLTLAAGSFTAILVLAVGPAPWRRLSPPALLGTATATYLVGTGLCAGATAMASMVAGTVVRGVASGMLAGLTLSALGGLFHGEARTRVYGMFALVWLLPSVAGPAVNAALTVAFGLPPDRTYPVATAVQFSEAAGAAVGAFIGGQTYSLARAAGLPARTGIAWAYVILALLAAATVITAARSRS